MAAKKKDGEVRQVSAPWVMSPEQIVREGHTLSDEIDLSPPQLAAMLQTSEDQLKTMRENGDGPPFEKLGEGRNAPVRYNLGATRQWRKSRTFLNTASVRVSRFSGMSDYLSTGAIEDEFIAAKDSDGRQWDFWEAIRQKVDVIEVVWQPMDKMLEGFRLNAGARSAKRAGDAVREATQPGSADGRKPPL